MEFETISGKKIRRILTDNGSEFKNQRLMRLCQYEHINLLFSAPYTPEQNGGAEHTNRTLQEMARAMLLDSKLNGKLRGEALSNAAYITNRIFRRGEQKTPFEILTGRKPELKHLVPFGTEAHIRVNDAITNKFDSRTEKAYIIGFTERSNTYRVLTKVNKKIKVTCDIILSSHNEDDNDRAEQQEEDNEILTFNVSKKSFLEKYFEKYSEELRSEAGDDASSTINQGNDEPPLSKEQPNRSIEETENFQTACMRTSTPLAETTNPFIQEETIVQDIRLNSGQSQSNEVNLTIGKAPASFSDVMNSRSKGEWVEAMKNELDAHKKNGTWQVCDKPTDQRLITSKWVFTTKKDRAGNISRFEARLVARGFEQIEGKD